MKNVETLLKKLSLKEKDTVVVAVSGGPDSMALLQYALSVLPNTPFYFSMCTCKS